MIEISQISSRIKVPIRKYWISHIFLSLHDSLNPQIFDDYVFIPENFDEFVNLVYDTYNQKRPIMDHLTIPRRDVSKNNKVLLGFSAGLDSVAQYLLLKEAGYDVIPYSMFNVNYYENGQASICVKNICKKLNTNFIQANFIHNFKKDNSHRKFWNENPIKNQMILATMVDYCLENDIYNISLGDDFDLNLKDSVNGTNTTDAHEITEAFLSGLSHITNISFLPMKKGFNKLERIKLLMKYGLEDEYYSCVLPGKFNQARHNGNQEKFGIKLFGRNCGCSCRKCSHHNLMLHYSGLRTFPEKFIEDCWKKLGDKNSADYVFFNKNVKLENRIRNLFEY